MRFWRTAALFGALTLSAIGAACTVTPLYGTSGSGAMNLPAEMKRIWISSPKDRLDQEIRNHLAFDFYGGGERPTDPKYQFDMVAYSTVSAGAAVYDLGVRAGEAPPSAATLTVTVQYALIDVVTGDEASSGQTSAAASYDLRQQGFADERAKRDAENRAAREVARNISLMIAADLRSGE